VTVADTEPPDELSASGGEPARWPDPSRPIVSDRHGGHPQQGGYYPSPSGLPVGPPRRRVWTRILIAVMVLMAVLVTVWLLWWR
jgi:hypothetical protein